MRLEQMTKLKEKMDSYGITPNEMPELTPSRRTSEKHISQPTTPTTPLFPSMSL